MVLVRDAGTRGRTGTPPPPPAQQPTAPFTTPADPDLARRIAVVLGIMAGDDYGVAPDAAPPDKFAHVFAPVNKPQQFGIEGDPLRASILEMAKSGAQKAITPPTHGGTIYSGSFAHDLLASLNLPVTYENIRFINAWMRAETGSQGKGTPAYNPLATTQNYGSNTNFNSVGVKNYADYHTGVMATANVLVNGKYQPILDALARGNDAMAAARAVSQTPWGTGSGVVKVLGGGG